MKHFIVTYDSLGNQESGTLYIGAESLKEAQDRFFAYLKTTQLYSHMWNVHIKFEELQGALP